ncbi:MAG TPA: hypothetical protein DDY22_05505 [Geobacter sp.]|nr:hypothetical protein [Geobacter sp.]
MALSDQILQLLACPGCRGKLVEIGESLHCPSCGLKFPVRDGIPVLLLSEAEKEE